MARKRPWRSFFNMTQFKKYLLAPLLPILLQADQATVASEEAAQGFQSDFDWIKYQNQSEVKNL